MSRSWLEISVVTENEQQTEAVTDVLQLFALDEEGVATEQLGDPNDVNPTALLPQTLVKLYIDTERDSAEIRTAISNALDERALPTPTYCIIEEQDWAETWKQSIKPLRIGERFWIRPSWIESAPPNVDDIVIELDPGMAFGTGTHETTQLCLALLEKYVRKGMAVLDAGCGSGILAIGAAKLGAAPIVAFDNDPLAIAATVQNSAENQVAAAIDARLGTLTDIAASRWHVVVANILAPILQGMLRKDGLLNYVDQNGVLILSGILAVQSAEICQTIEQVGGRLIEKVQKGDWVALVAQIN